MAVIAIGSAKGSPGVTTAALALAFTWPRPVILVEADTAGSSVLAGYYAGQQSLDHGLSQLLFSHSTERLLSQFLAQSIPLSVDSDTRRLVPGITTPGQAGAMREHWGPLSSVMASLDADGTDVILDMGRISFNDDRSVLLRTADQVLLASRSQLPAIYSLRDLALELRDAFGQGEPWALSKVGLMAIGEGSPYSIAEIVKATGLPASAVMKWDPDAAAVFSDGRSAPKKFDRSPLIRSAQTSAEGIRARINSRRNLIQPEIDPGASR